MIVKGKSRNNAGQAGSYLLTLDENERVELIETRGTVAQDVKGACLEMEALAAGSDAEKPFYHASINPAKGEHLTPEQWEKAVEILEEKLGLEDHQRIVVEHEKDGRAHRHILWNRVDPETLTAKRMSWNYVQHEKTARELEKTFGLDRVQGVHVDENGQPLEKGDERRADFAPTRHETETAKKNGVNLYKWRKEIRKIAEQTEGKSGAELVEALEAKGHMVAKGDKVAFVILDPSGKAHRMAQSLGLNVEDLKERLSDLDPAAIPRESEAREKQQEQQAQLEKEKGFTLYDSGGMAQQQTDAIRDLKERQKANSLREARATQEAARVAEKKGNFKEAGRETTQQPTQQTEQQKAGNRKEKEVVPVQSQSQSRGEQQSEGDSDRRKQHYSQRESLLRDIAPAAMQRRATTEQTERKQRMSAKEAMKEVAETDFSKYRSPAAKERDGWEMERERER
ncbi:MAG: relaxase/mobilization nuclease domain-containing protein [Caedimonadaceae bacterium]|nr:MAG: relaxase/mobilization nuclease domain-containing protein [Caedimonadaceae bacterium]